MVPTGWVTNAVLKTCQNMLLWNEGKDDLSLNEEDQVNCYVLGLAGNQKVHQLVSRPVDWERLDENTAEQDGGSAWQNWLAIVELYMSWEVAAQQDWSRVWRQWSMLGEPPTGLERDVEYARRTPQEQQNVEHTDPVPRKTVFSSGQDTIVRLRRDAVVG